jgi:hypothetical protein
MEQRPLRLGDQVDDYCPRERRITNHAIVALVNNEIRQTRCTACDSEHEYKEARVPRRRKKAPTAALYDEVLAEVAGGQLVTPADGVAEDPPPAAPPGPEPAEVPDTPAPVEVNGAEAPETMVAAVADEPTDGSDDRNDEPDVPEEAGSHRRLIRATLPRSESDEPPPRPIPEFTMHQRQGRGGQNFRGRGGNDQGRGGHGHGRGGFRHGQADGNRDPQGQANGNRSRRGGKGRRRGSRKRSR